MAATIQGEIQQGATSQQLLFDRRLSASRPLAGRTSGGCLKRDPHGFQKPGQQRMKQFQTPSKPHPFTSPRVELTLQAWAVAHGILIRHHKEPCLASNCTQPKTEPGPCSPYCNGCMRGTSHANGSDGCKGCQSSRSQDWSAARALASSTYVRRGGPTLLNALGIT